MDGLLITNYTFKGMEIGGLGVAGFGCYKGNPKAIVGGVSAAGVGFIGATTTDVMLKRRYENNINGLQDVVDGLLEDNQDIAKKNTKLKKKVKKLNKELDYSYDEIDELKKKLKKLKKKSSPSKKNKNSTLNELFGGLPFDFDDVDEDDDDDDYDAGCKITGRYGNKDEIGNLFPNVNVNDESQQIPIYRKNRAGGATVKSFEELHNKYPNASDFKVEQADFDKDNIRIYVYHNNGRKDVEYIAADDYFDEMEKYS